VSERGRHFDPELLDIFVADLEALAAVDVAPARDARRATPVTVLVAHSSGMFADALVRRLDGAPGITVVGTSTSTLETRAIARDRDPDVVVVDDELPDAGGAITTRQLRADDGRRAIVVLAERDDDEKLFRAIDAGAAGRIVKERALHEIAPAVLAAHAGAPLVAGGRLVTLLQREGAPHANGSVLTASETTAIRLLAEGLSTEAIAERLALTDAEAAACIERVLTKLHARSTIEAVVVAARRGIVGGPPPTPSTESAPRTLTLPRIPVPLALVDLATRHLVAANRAFASLVGIELGQLVGVDLLSLTSGEERALGGAIMAGLASGKIDA
jgi:DNA-binding NarL/FixJ family response regulator